MENAHLNSDFLLRKLRGNKTYPAHGVCPQRLLQEWLHQDLGPLHRLLCWMVEAQIFGWVNIEAQTCGCCLTVRSHRRLAFLFLKIFKGRLHMDAKNALAKCVNFSALGERVGSQCWYADSFQPRAVYVWRCGERVWQWRSSEVGCPLM